MKKLLFVLILSILILFVVVIALRKHQGVALENSVFVDGHEFKIELADTDEKRKSGLGKRESLCLECAMLFVFERSGRQSFWMKDMRFPLDIIWIADSEIVYIAKNIPADYKDIITPGVLADKVLEINGGLCDEYQIREGDKITFGSN